MYQSRSLTESNYVRIKRTRLFMKTYLVDRAVLTKNVHRVCKNMSFVCLCALLWCMFCFHVCTYVYFRVISNVQIVRAFETRIPIQTFEKWYNVSYRYVSYLENRCMVFKIFWIEGRGKPYLRFSKTEFYGKN